MSIKIIKNNSISIDSPYKIFSGAAGLAESYIPEIKENNFEEDRIAAALSKESEILRNANLEADKILNAAKTDAASFFDEKIQEGFMNGYREGLLKAEKEMEKKLDELDEIKTMAKSEYAELIRSAEPDIINLVMNISRKFLEDKVENDKKIIIEIVRDTILKFTDANELTVTVSSQDYSYVLDNKASIMAKTNSLQSLEIINDDNLKPGSCLVESKDNSVDASVDKRFENIQETFEELLKYAR